MRLNYNYTYAYQDWRSKYPNTPNEMFVYNKFIDIRKSKRWFEPYVRYTYDGCPIKSITLFKIRFIWGVSYDFLDDEDDRWVKYKEDYDNQNRKNE